jgi:exosortase/archaeosortase
MFWFFIGWIIFSIACGIYIVHYERKEDDLIVEGVLILLCFLILPVGQAFCIYNIGKTVFSFLRKKLSPSLKIVVLKKYGT